MAIAVIGSVCLLGVLGLRVVGADRAGSTVMPPGRGVVLHVIDGDTIDVRLGAGRERVRLLGVDAPESVAPTVPVQCYGAEASEALRQLLPEGTVVDLTRDVEGRDHYGRLLAYVHRTDDGLLVNRWLIDEGYADAVSYQPNSTYQAAFATAARTAERSARGLWAHCDGPDQPLDPTP